MTNKELSNSEITTSLSEQGFKQQPWWVEQWMELINSYRFKKRLERAWIYAKSGNVTSIRFEGRKIHARVQGTDEEPYKVKLWLDVLNDEDWSYVLEALNQKAKWSAQLLAGIMPIDIERAFASSGRRLFPFKLEDIRSECTCPDKANPCKHISAIYYLMGDRFREDPFVLFQLRGRTREKLLFDLAELRRKSIADINANNKKTSKNSIETLGAINRPRGLSDPTLWWKYQNNLNNDLVVITSSSDSDTGIHAAGDLPLAEDPIFPSSKNKFLEHLHQHREFISQEAMLRAMNAGTK